MARQAGTDAASALLGAGLMDEDAYYRALAWELGVPFLDGEIPLGWPLRYPACLQAGIAPLAPGLGAVAAPRGEIIATLLVGAGGSALPAITTPSRLRRAVYAAIPGTVAARAARGSHDPRRAPWLASHRLMVLALMLAACLGLVAALPAPAAVAMAWAAQILCLAVMMFRAAAPVIPPPRDAAPPLPDAALPVYTVLVALYREAAVVPRLIPALAALDYPAAKLDIKLLIEADDPETADALASIPLPARFEVVTVPPGTPRTKPRALNAALPLARGSLLVVFDAEDVPARDQLRRAAARFAHEPTLACLQGRLVIDNHEGRLPRFFALEYTGLFDVLNPALAALGMPIPLGGSSTHVRTDVLRRLNGWDVATVTEDAELGLRLALAGERVGDLPSETWEEAPVRLEAWLRQRSRWMKGFLQTSLIHGRHPVAVLARLGPLRTLCALALVPGTVLSALAYPVCCLLAVIAVPAGWIAVSPSPLDNLGLGLAATVFLVGLVVMGGPAICGCRRRQWPHLWGYVTLLPLYYLLVSLAAWMAVVEFVRAPDHWNKTEHGLSRTSRSGRLRRVC
ncbi:MAG: glycosyltransferase [Actinomycetospora chiangmaiensis]|nr:glycosyltransferase [Actinomycetospora chiangmaiensis]